MAADSRPAFVRRAPGTPCPVCEHQSWCTVSEDGEVVRCMRIESAQESEGGDGSLGWIHRVKERVQVQAARAEKKRVTLSEIKAMARECYSHPSAEKTRQALSESLSVSLSSLEAMRVGYGCDHDGKEWSSWPSRDERGQIIGIIRRYLDGSKKTMPGHRCGVYYPLERKGLKGPVLIVEGGSDVAAAYTVGLPAIGRPSNTGGVKMIQAILKGVPCIVVGERDEAPERRGTLSTCPVNCVGCGNCAPGEFGARIVAKKLNCPYVMPPEGVKDFRDAVRRGVAWWELLRMTTAKGGLK